MLLCVQTAADCTLCECARWAVVGENRRGGVIRWVTYVPFILIPSKKSELIKVASDAILSPLINGCANHTKMH